MGVFFFMCVCAVCYYKLLQTYRRRINLAFQIPSNKQRKLMQAFYTLNLTHYIRRTGLIELVGNSNCCERPKIGSITYCGSNRSSDQRWEITLK